MTLSRIVSVCALAFAVSAPFAQADDAVARDLYGKALEKYRLHRADSLQISKEILETLTQAEAQVRNVELKYDILVLASRTLYWQGQHTDGDDNKKVIHLKGLEKGKQAIAVTDEFSEGFFFAGINLARWAEANGIVASISRKGELIEFMEQASDLSRTTRDGSKGESVDGNGPDRVLGRMYEKLPGILGGDHDLAVRLLRKAVAESKWNALNVLYLADSLLKGNNAEKAEGKTVLNNLIANDVNAFGAHYDRLPETIEEFALARGLLNGRPIP